MTTYIGRPQPGPVGSGGRAVRKPGNTTKRKVAARKTNHGSRVSAVARSGAGGKAVSAVARKAPMGRRTGKPKVSATPYSGNWSHTYDKKFL